MAAPRKTDVFDEFILFKSLTPSEQLEEYGFTTHKGFAEKFDISEKQLSHWVNHDKKFDKRRIDMVVNSRVKNRMVELVDRMMERAIDDGDMNAIKETNKMIGLTTEKLEIVTTQKLGDFAEAVIVAADEVFGDYPELLNIFAEKIGQIDV